MRRLVAWLMTLAFAAAMTAAAGQGITSVVPPSRAPVAPEYFGLIVHSLVVPQKRPSGDRLTSWPSVPFGSWRLWDVRVLWADMEPQRGRWDFSRLDRYVELARQHRVEILLTLAMTPAWASQRPEEKSAYGLGYAAPPKDIEDWRNFVRTIAQRYKGRIRNYEVWNEVNYARFFSGTPTELVDIARVAFQTLKDIDPANVVVLPSVVGDRGHLDWFDRYLALGGKDYADVVGYHFYVPKGRPEDMLPIIARVRQIMARNGLGAMPLWNTEAGWGIANARPEARIGAVEPDWKQLDGEMAAAYLVRAYVLGAAAGLGRFYWYAWDNPEMGLVDAGDHSPKPAVRAFAAVRNLLVGSTMESCALDAGTWVCRLGLADAKPALIVWRAADDNGRLQLPAGWATAAGESIFDGRAVVVASGFVEVGPHPLVLRPPGVGR